MWAERRSTMRRMIATLSMTIRLLTRADSLMPITSTVDIRATMKYRRKVDDRAGEVEARVRAAGRPCRTCDVGAPLGRRVGEMGGSTMPNRPSRLTKCPDQPTPTVAAPAAYSSTRSQPMIQATSSPMVA